MSNRAFFIAALFLTTGAALVAFAAPPTVHYFLSSVAIWAIFAIGFDLAFGAAGLLSFGHAAFFGMGGYAVAMLTTLAGWPVLLALPAGGLASAVLAGLVGTLALRLSGVYLGLTTLAVAQLLETIVAVRLRAYTGGMEGIVGVGRPSVFGYALQDDRSFFLFVFIVFMVVLGFSAMLRGSSWGRGLVAMRLNEVRAEQIGFNILRLKISAFAVSGLICGVAGGLLASLMRFVNPEVLGWTISGDVLIATLLGGSGTLFGPVVGALVVACLREALDGLTTHWHGILGLILVAFILWMPKGLLPMAKDVFGKLRSHG